MKKEITIRPNRLSVITLLCLSVQCYMVSHGLAHCHPEEARCDVHPLYSLEYDDELCMGTTPFLLHVCLVSIHDYSLARMRDASTRTYYSNTLEYPRG
mmetsp:Transcript_23814/g.66516  ORF Transcript_23814/g.66516 Transcript_23814/m.66516 type:complete len:98 (+) Transcript_23814:1316-1609(+)